MKYFNYSNEQYLIGFKDKEPNLRFIYRDELTRRFSVNSDITIISHIINTNSIFYDQMKHNNIEVIKCLHSADILNEITKVNTKYILVIDCYDCMVVNDLDTNFINKSNDFIVSGYESPYPDLNIEVGDVYTHSSGPAIFPINCFVFGATENVINLNNKMLSFIKYLNTGLNQTENNQLALRLSLASCEDLFNVDSNYSLFTVMYNNNLQLEQRDPEIRKFKPFLLRDYIMKLF